MSPPTASAAGAAMRSTRRSLLAALAASPMAAAAALPAVAGSADDAELLALEAEIRRYEGEVQSIYDARITPHAEEHDRTFGQPVTKESMRAADEFSKRVGRDQAINETWDLFAKSDELTKRLFRTPAKTVAGARPRSASCSPSSLAKMAWSQKTSTAGFIVVVSCSASCRHHPGGVAPRCRSPLATIWDGGRVLHLSTLIHDPFVARAFRRAEREDGTAPAIATASRASRS